MGLNILTLGSSKTYTNLVALGISSVVVDDTAKTITFTLASDGSQHTIHFDQPSDGKDGISVTGISDKGNGVFTLLLSDGSESDPIQTVKGQKGDKGDKLTFNDLTDEEKASLKGANGVSPTITENADNTDKIYKLDIETVDGKFTTPNLKGADGTGGTGSGEENVIESIKVNGVVQTVADDKSVDITVPTVDVDKNYVDTELANKSDIDHTHTTVNGHTVESDVPVDAKFTDTVYDDTDIKAEIAKKADATAIPSKVSELTNDSNYQTAEQVNSTVTTEIAKVVADAPEDLNTLKEMSDWIAGHENDASAMNSAISDNKTSITALQTGKADKNEIPTTVSELTDSADYAKKTDIPTTLPANGGNSDTVNNHTVKSDVPENAVFTDTTYSDATQIEHGLMSVDDKKKLDGLKKYTPDGSTITADEDGTLHGVAEVTVDDALSSTSTNPVQNKVIKAYVDENVDFSTSTSKLLNDTVEAPLVLSNATRNLLNPDLQTVTKNGITCTNNGDGTYTLNGTATDNVFFDINTNISINKGTKYKVVCFKDEDYVPNKILSCVRRVDTTDEYIFNNGSFVSDSENCWLWLEITKNVTVSNLVAKPMLTTDLNATYDDFVPYSGYDIKTCGKNLLNLVKITYANVKGATASVSNGIITLNGTVDTSDGWQDLYFDTVEQYVSFKKGVKYTISTKDKVQKVFIILRESNSLKVLYSHDCSTNGTTFVASQDVYCKVTVTFKETSTFNDTQIAPQIEVGEKATEYEPYQDGGSVHIDSSTEFPLFGLRSFDGITNIISPGNVKCVYSTNESGKGVLDSLYNKDKMLTEQNKSLEVLGKCKNLLKPTLQTTTNNGVTCTNNGDGTYTLNGTNNSESEVSFTIKLNIYNEIKEAGGIVKVLFHDNNYDDNVNGRIIAAQASEDYSKWYGETRSGQILKLKNETRKIAVDVHINSGITLNNVLIKPMITTDLNATYDDFVPYTGDGETLTHDVAEINESLGALGKCKNLLNPTLQTSEMNGITCTNNGDGTYTLNGTATGYKAFVLTELHSNIGRFAGCKIVGLPSGTDTNNIDLSVSYRSANGDASHGTNFGDIVDDAQDTDKSVKVLLIVRHAQTISNVVVKPMLTTNLSATYDDFIPYTGDGDTLASDVAEIKNDLGGLSFSASGTTLTITDGTNTWTLGANS